MLIPLDTIIKKFNMKIKGILHVGAHECEEIIDYDKYISRENVLWIDALQDKVDYCKAHFNNILIEQAIISDKIETVTFHRSNNGQSSSIFEFGLHANYHPHVCYVDSFQQKTKLLKDIICNYPNIHFNFINFDIQGAELKALISMGNYLHKVDYVYIEVNSNYVYKGCNLISEIDNYLISFNLYRAEVKWTDFEWGDALYIRFPIN
jgi:FkbM family methyltransferase